MAGGKKVPSCDSLGILVSLREYTLYTPIQIARILNQIFFKNQNNNIQIRKYSYQNIQKGTETDKHILNFKNIFI